MSYDNETEDYYELLDKQFEEDQVISLIVSLFEYSSELEEMVVELRRTINALSDKDRPPFPDLLGDIYQTFDDYSAYRKAVLMRESNGTKRIPFPISWNGNSSNLK